MSSLENTRAIVFGFKFNKNKLMYKLKFITQTELEMQS